MITGFIDWLRDPVNWSGVDGIPNRLIEHIGYSVLALVLAAAIGIPLGLYIGHTGKGKFLVAGLANAFRALPTLGLVILAAIIVGPLLPGDAAYLVPSIFVLVVLAVPPILATTYAGVEGVDEAARDAAYGMGMTGGQVLFKIETPCALPLMMSGIRSAMLQIVSTATIAAVVSLGGLGRFVLDGLANQQYQVMLGGAILVALLAVAFELVLAFVQWLLVPRGLSKRTGRRELVAETATESVAKEEELVAAR